MEAEDQTIDLRGFNDVIRNDLIDSMRRVGPDGDSKILFMQRNIYSVFHRLNILTDALSERNDVVGCFVFGTEVDYLPARHLVYFLNPDLEQLRSFAIHLLSYTQRFPQAVPHVFFVPRKPLMVEQILENDFKLLQSFPNMQLDEFDFDAACVEPEVVSMQLPLTFKHLYVDGDVTSVTWIARLLLKVQSSRFGAIPIIRGKGSKAVKVVHILNRMQNEVGEDLMSGVPSIADNLFIVDRTLDLATPLLTQLTYEGLIDELYGIDAGASSFPFSLGDGSKISTGEAVTLDSSDKLFVDIRDKNFTNVGAALYQKSMWVKQSYEKRKEVQKLKELKEFMKNLPEMQELHRLIGIHTTIATEVGKVTQTPEFRRRIQVEQCIIQQVNDREVMDYIDDQINERRPLSSVLRILCLYSVINNGVRPREYDALKEAMMLSYGIPQIASAFFCLSLCGLLVKSEGKPSNYATLRKQFRTWNTTLNEHEPNDIAYTYSGYAPLMVRLLEEVINSPGLWGASNSIVDILPGPKAEIRSNVEVSSEATGLSLVFVIGGVTLAEMSSLRFVQEQLAKANKNRRIVLLTTDVTTGKRLINSVVPTSVGI